MEVCQMDVKVWISLGSLIISIFALGVAIWSACYARKRFFATKGATRLSFYPKELERWLEIERKILSLTENHNPGNPDWIFRNLLMVLNCILVYTREYGNPQLTNRLRKVKNDCANLLQGTVKPTLTRDSLYAHTMNLIADFQREILSPKINNLLEEIKNAEDELR